jgi:uncharacterized protein (DUF885 family)
MEAGLMPPRFLLEKAAAQALGIAGQRPDDSAFAHPFADFAGTIPDAERARLRQAGIAAIREEVLPSYARFARFVKDEYAPRGRTEPGLWSLSDGAERYAAAVRSYTTTDLTPEQIHAVGLREVADLEGQMMLIAQRLGFKDLKTLNSAIEKDPKLHPKSREEILDLYRRYVDGMYPELPKLFGRLPKASRRRGPSKPSAKPSSRRKLQPGDARRSRAGRIQVNTGEPQSRTTITMESTAYHGRRSRASSSDLDRPELEGLPLRQQAAVHGLRRRVGALFRAPRERGRLLQAALQHYGRLGTRCCGRSVSSWTRLHHKRWSREQMVQFFHDHSGRRRGGPAERDRPLYRRSRTGLACKIAQLKILELRSRAERALPSASTSAASTTPSWAAVHSPSTSSRRGSVGGSPRKRPTEAAAHLLTQHLRAGPRPSLE